MQILFSQPAIGKEEIAAVTKILQSGWLVEGQETQLFEQELQKFLGAKHVIATSGATEALFLLLKAYGIGPSDEVIIPSFTFAATAQAVIHAQAKPVFADVTPYPHLCLDPTDVANKRSSKTKAVIPVHYAGNQAFCNYDNLTVIEDSAHRIEQDDFRGNPMALSFHATKNMTTGRGGAILINDDEKAQWLKEARNFGINKDSSQRHQEGAWKYAINFAGWSFHLTDIAASIGRVQLKKLPTFLSERKRITQIYNKLLQLNNSGLHLYPILVHDRDEFIAWMLEHKVQCSVHFQPLHQMQLFKNSTRLPVTEYAGDKIVSLPLYPNLSDKQVIYIADLVQTWRKQHGQPT